MPMLNYMIKVFVARHPTEAHLVKSLLELEGIAVEIHSEALYGALGGTVIASDTLPSLWVQEGSQADKAIEVVRRYVSGQGSPDSFGKPWICPECGETIESQFTSCWKCGCDPELYKRGKASDNAFKSSELPDDLKPLKMNLPVLFRYLVISSFILYIIGFFMPYFWNSIYDQQTLDILSWNHYGRHIQRNVWLPYLFLFLYTITYWGLIYFKWWARLAYVVLMILSFILAFYSGMIIQTAFECMVGSLIGFIDGAIITIMYFTNLSFEFDKN
jgi:hypothetical protein